MSNDWREIWRKKYTTSAPTHVKDGFDNLSILQWQQLVNIFSNLIQIDEDSDILDVGCGAGAFLEQIKKYNSLSGIDYSAGAIQSIQKKLNGNFQVAEANKSPFENNLFNSIICFSVFFYFSSLKYAEEVINEMLRVCRSNGRILIGDVNDIAKLELYNAVRQKENRNLKHIKKNYSIKHLFYEKDFFIKIAKKNKIKISIIDEERLDIPFYSCSSYRFSVIYET